MKELDQYRRLLKHLPDPVKEAEVNGERLDILMAGISDGKPAAKKWSDVTSLFVRASGEKTGFTYTENLEEDSEAVLMRAYDNGLSGENREEMLKLEDKQNVWREPELTDHLPVETLEIMAANLEKRIRSVSPLMVHIEAEVSETIRTLSVVNSFGVDRTTVRKWLSAEVTVTAGEQEEWNRYFFCSWKRPEDIKPGELLYKRAADWLAKQQVKPAESFQSGSKRAVLGADVMTNILATAWQALDAVHYDNGSTPWKGELGNQILSPEVSITDYPVHGANGYQFPMDCEGIIGKQTSVVKKGRLLNLLHTAATANHSSVNPTGNAGRKNLLSGNLHTNVIPIPRNFVMEPGKWNQEELLKQLGDGVYIDESFDVFHSINIASGEFHIPCRGILVENGALAGRIGGITIDGNLQDLLQQVEAVGEDLTFRTMDILKSYCVAAPSILVKQLNISGTEGEQS